MQRAQDPMDPMTRDGYDTGFITETPSEAVDGSLA